MPYVTEYKKKKRANGVARLLQSRESSFTQPVRNHNRVPKQEANPFPAQEKSFLGHHNVIHVSPCGNDDSVVDTMYFSHLGVNGFPDNGDGGFVSLLKWKVKGFATHGFLSSFFSWVEEG
jgi:hypothetical protein